MQIDAGRVAGGLGGCADQRWQTALVQRGGPSKDVLASFGLGALIAWPQSGGQGDAWRTEHVLLKPVDNDAAAAWCAQVLAELPERGFRIARPVASVDGDFVVGGWSAWNVVEGEHDLRHRWPEVIRIGMALNEALAAATRPPFLKDRTDVWAVGDRVAWDEQPLEVHDPTLRSFALRLYRYVEPSTEESQLIHGDLSGNVLFHPGVSPAVIDFTAYWRPALFSLAVVAVDAVSWYGADQTLFNALPDNPTRDSILARAGLYRLVTSDRAARLKPPASRNAYLADVTSSVARLLTNLDAWIASPGNAGPGLAKP